jgi:excisionase family DNA binding protein
MEKRFYSLKEVAELLMVSELWVRRRIATGDIPNYKVGGKRLFKIDEIEQWLYSLKEKKVASK